MRCKTTSIYLQGCKLQVASLTKLNKDGSSAEASKGRRRRTLVLNDGDMVQVDTRFGPLQLVFESSSALGRKGRNEFDPAMFATGSEDPALQQRKYVAAAFDAQDADINLWPANAYSLDLLQHAKSTFDPATGFNLLGFDALGFDARGLNRRGFNRLGVHSQTLTEFDPEGYDVDGFSASGLERPRSWYARMLDVSPNEIRYQQLTPSLSFASPERQWDVASRLIRQASQAASSSQPSFESLAHLVNDVISQAVPLARQELATTLPHVLRLSEPSLHAAQEVSERLEQGRDPEDLAFDRAVLKTLIKRRVSGRFSLPDLHSLSDQDMDRLAASMLRDVRAQALLDIKNKQF